MSEILSRREFLLYGGATVAGITLGEMGRRQLARADERASAWRERGLETWATSVCRECPAACGVRARLVDGVPVKLEGNPACPIARGRLCAKGQAALESYFDPDRLLGPARRAGKRGENRWAPISWASAIELAASQVRSAQERPGAVSLALAAEEQGPLAEAWRRFWEAAGARVVWTPAASASRLGPGLRALTGAETSPVFDLEHASHVLSFGAPVVEDWLSSPVWAQRSYGRFRRGASRSRGRLVQVEARRSLTARKADEWLPVPAPKQFALAYGIAAVLLRENRVDRAFLDELGGNLGAFEREVVARFSPDDVAAMTGVPVVTVLRLARELAASPRPMVVVAADADRALVEAAFALDALVGALDRAGGVVGGPARSAGEPDDAAAALRAVAAGRLRPRLLALRDASALRSPFSPADLAKALDATELVVSFSPFLDETASLADLLLPSPTALESWQAVCPAPAAPVEALALAPPAVRPRLDTRDPAAVLRAVAEAAGGRVKSACAWTSSEDLVGAEVNRLWGLRRGTPYADGYETEWVRQLESGGWWVAPASSRDAFAAAVLRAGGWVDPFAVSGQIRESLRGRGGLTFALPGTGRDEAGPRPAPLPAPRAGELVAPRSEETGAEASLSVVPFTPTAVNLMGSPNQPVLFELLGQPESPLWQLWAELAPETARALSIEPGSRIRVVSSHGAIEAVALLVEGAPADGVGLPFIPSVPGGGRWARLVRADIRRLWGDGGVSGPCSVRVTRA